MDFFGVIFYVLCIFWFILYVQLARAGLKALNIYIKKIKIKKNKNLEYIMVIVLYTKGISFSG